VFYLICVSNTIFGFLLLLSEIIKVDAATSSSEGSSNNTTIIDQQTLAAITPTASQSQTEIKNARLLLSLHYQRSDGGYRYAIKYLKSNVISTPEKYLIGTVDLVIEGMFLSSLSHPNIIKLRGLPQGGIMSLCNDDDDNNNNSSDNNGGGGGVSNNMGYFLVLDRLYDTLGDRIYDDWKINHVQTVRKAGLFNLQKNKDDILDRNEDMSIRLKVAMDMSAAIKYLHEKNIIYRDLKPENLGFDVRDDIKLFDLGLVKELHVADKKNDGTYNLSLAGTPRYMAPEVGLYMPYNL
jgi:serine/threonine protein kinase